MISDKSSFLRQHFLYPCVLLVIASALILTLNIDMRLEDYLYNLQGHAWTLKNNWLTEKVLHRGGRILSITLATFVFFLLISSFFVKSFQHKRKQFLYLFLAIVGASFLVSLLKMSLAISCPWEFDRYGGSLGYKNVIEQLYLRNGEGCFPAAQASAGYSWVALYFFGLFFQSRFRWLGLSIALTSGFVLGFAQQIRGAHFVSHDLWSLAVCWFYCLGLYVIFERSAKPRLHNHIAIPAGA